MELAFFIILLLAFAASDIHSMLDEKKKAKEIAVYLSLIALSAAFGIFYLSNPERNSFSYIVIKLLKLKGY